MTNLEKLASSADRLAILLNSMNVECSFCPAYDYCFKKSDEDFDNCVISLKEWLEQEEE